MEPERYLYAITRVLTDENFTNTEKLVNIKKLLLLFYDEKRSQQ